MRRRSRCGQRDWQDAGAPSAKAKHLPTQRACAHRDVDVIQRLADRLVGIAGAAQPRDLRGIRSSLAIGATGLAFGVQLHGRARFGDTVNLGRCGASGRDDLRRKFIGSASGSRRMGVRPRRLSDAFAPPRRWVVTLRVSSESLASALRRLADGFAAPCGAFESLCGQSCEPGATKSAPRGSQDCICR